MLRCKDKEKLPTLVTGKSTVVRKLKNVQPKRNATKIYKLGVGSVLKL